MFNMDIKIGGKKTSLSNLDKALEREFEKVAIAGVKKKISGLVDLETGLPPKISFKRGSIQFTGSDELIARVKKRLENL